MERDKSGTGMVGRRGHKVPVASSAVNTSTYHHYFHELYNIMMVSCEMNYILIPGNQFEALVNKH